MLDEFDPSRLSPDSRFGPALYVGETPSAIMSEMSHYGNDVSNAIRYTINPNAAKVLELTDPEIAKAWGYVGSNSRALAIPIVERAKAEGYNAIRFYSERSALGEINNAVLCDWNKVLIPQMVTPVKQ